MKHNLPESEISAVFRKAIRQGVTENLSLLMFHDLDFLDARLNHLIEIFPAGTVHAVAMKANPLIKILDHLQKKGAGAEAASIGELRLALHAGYSPEKIVFDSPVKTIEELEFAIRAGVHINIDNPGEFDRIKQIRGKIKSNSTYGIRINPQVGTGTIATSSVAGKYSKFGIPLLEKRQALMDLFLENEWLTGVHLHIGSQGCSPEMLVNGTSIIYNFALEVNERAARNQIRIFDLGGGFPVSYDPEKTAPLISEYAATLKAACPRLFTSDFTLVTEFGRWLHVNAGWTVSRVEYVKHDGETHTAMLHAGADLFLRECLLPSDWKHGYLVLDPEGNVKKGNESVWQLAGPLCFSGDMLSKDVVLPEIEEGDYLIIRDTGGYTLSMWSRYNSRLMPKVVGYRKSSFVTLKEPEQFTDLVGFWK